MNAIKRILGGESAAAIAAEEIAGDVDQRAAELQAEADAEAERQAKAAADEKKLAKLSADLDKLRIECTDLDQNVRSAVASMDAAFIAMKTNHNQQAAIQSQIDALSGGTRTPSRHTFHSRKIQMREAIKHNAPEVWKMFSAHLMPGR